jgi:hypothetical protein
MADNPDTDRRQYSVLVAIVAALNVNQHTLKNWTKLGAISCGSSRKGCPRNYTKRHAMETAYLCALTGLGVTPLAAKTMIEGRELPVRGLAHLPGALAGTEIVISADQLARVVDRFWSAAETSQARELEAAQ